MILPSYIFKLHPEFNDDLQSARIVSGTPLVPSKVTADDIVEVHTHKDPEKLTIITNAGQEILLTFWRLDAVTTAIEFFSLSLRKNRHLPGLTLSPNKDIATIRTVGDDPAPSFLPPGYVAAWEEPSMRVVRLINNQGDKIEVLFRTSQGKQRFVDELREMNELAAPTLAPTPDSNPSLPAPTRSPLSTARIIDIDPDTNSMVSWATHSRTASGSVGGSTSDLLPKRLVVSHVETWGIPQMSTSSNASLCIVLSSGSRINLVFKTEEDKALFEQELTEKVGAL